MPRSPSSPARSYTRSPSRSRSPTPSTADTIRITKLTKNVTTVHLEEIFDVYGKIVDIDLPINKRLGTHKGTAWITFASPAAAAKAADYMDAAQIDGSTVTVVIEPPTPPRGARGASPPLAPGAGPIRRSRSRSPEPRGRPTSRDRSMSRSMSRSRSPDSGPRGRDLPPRSRSPEYT
jgi:RNA-binding protein with serine-rich domain 1